MTAWWMAPEWADRKGMDFGKFAKPCPSRMLPTGRIIENADKPWEKRPERARVYIGRRQVATC